MTTAERITAEIDEMIGAGNDPDLVALEMAFADTTDDHYNAGRIAGLRLALAIIEGAS